MLFRSSYKALLVHALRRPLLSLAPAMLCLLIAIVGIFGLGSSFLPEFNEGALTVSAVTLPGTSLEQSDKLGRMVEQIHLAHPEVVSVARRTGRAELDEHANGVEHTELDVRLKMQERSKEELDRKSTRLNSSHVVISYAVLCLKKKTKK